MLNSSKGRAVRNFSRCLAIDLSVIEWLNNWLFGLQADYCILLYSVHPFPFVGTPVLPIHLPISMTIVILEIAYVLRSVLPNIGSFPVLFVVHILSLVKVSVYQVPDPTPMTHP